MNTEDAGCPLPFSGHPDIVLAHGSGGRMSRELIEHIVLPEFRNTALDALHDGAVVSVGGARVAFTTDSYVVEPIFFPGGDIGALAVNGTVNDLAMCGATPLHLSVALILEEGFSMENFQRILRSMRAAADAAGVALVTGDTKVVDRGKADGIFINTAGIGIVPSGVEIDPRRAMPGDRIVLSGTIAEHGMAILSVREGLEFETTIESDAAPLNGLVRTILDAAPDVHVLRDPTRGGLSAALCEISRSSRVGIRIEEAAIPLREDVRAACELLGLDPLHVANEGKLVAFIPEAEAELALAAVRAQPLGRDSAIIGRVTAENPGRVLMRTQVGGNRIVDTPAGEQLPRIC